MVRRRKKKTKKMIVFSDLNDYEARAEDGAPGGSTQFMIIMMMIIFMDNKLNTAWLKKIV